MNHSWLSTLAAAAAVIGLCLTTGCAGPIGATTDSSLVAEAYNTPNIVQVKPYTRTIFSSTDF